MGEGTSPKIRVNYLLSNFRSTGGVKVLFQHVKLLRQRGHEANLLVKDAGGFDGRYFDFAPESVDSFSYGDMPSADIIVATVPKDVREVFRLRKHGVIVCHLSQGMEVVEIEERISVRVIPPRYRGRRVRYFFKRLSYLNRRRKLNSAYSLETVKIAVSRNVKDEIEKRYSPNCYLVPNGADRSVFYPSGVSRDYGSVVDIVSVGAYNGTTKGIPYLLEAVRILKDSGRKVRLTRVSYAPETKEEKESGVVDRYLMNLTETDMAGLYQNSHILVAPSLESEGFGLPAIEAMACGITCVLTEVPSYLGLGERRDYAVFVPPRYSEGIASAVGRIMDGENLRAGLIRGGLDVAGKYSLESTGKILEEVLIDVLKRKGG